MSNKIKFEDLSDEDKILYSKIENIIIIYSNDGTKTAGSLTREIMYLINQNKIK